MFIVADAADGADGVTGLILTYGRYSDCPPSQPALAAEDNLDPESAEEGLCPAQPASECAGVLWPARPVLDHGFAGKIDAGLQKVRCGSAPFRRLASSG
jgi:hypothetical protein